MQALPGQLGFVLEDDAPVVACDVEVFNSEKLPGAESLVFWRGFSLDHGEQAAVASFSATRFGREPDPGQAVGRRFSAAWLL